MLLWPDGHDWPDIDLVRIAAANLLFQVLLGLKGQVSQIDVIGQGE